MSPRKDKTARAEYAHKYFTEKYYPANKERILIKNRLWAKKKGVKDE